MRFHSIHMTRRWAACVLLAALAVFSAQAALAASCPVVKHADPTDAEKALLGADFARAETLFRAEVQKNPADAAAVGGLVHALLGQQKLKDAAEAVKTALAAAPTSGALLTLRGEVEFRQGEPWSAEPTAVAAYKADPCNPRTRLLYARVAQAAARNATAKQQFNLAHQFDPADPEIRLAWVFTLPVEQRGAELESFLAGPTGQDTMTVGVLKGMVESWKKLAGQPVHACKLAVGAAPAEVKFIKLAGSGGHARALGIEMGVNSATARLDLSTMEGGFSLYKPAAEKAGLKRITENDKPAFPGAKPSYLAYAEKVKIGNLEFHDCTLKVIDAGTPNEDGDGTVGLDVFGDFLETVDFPARKLQLAALPPNPQDAGYVPALHTDPYEGDGAASPHLTDRLIAPEMKDWTQVYRVGRGIVLPTAVNTTLIKLFALGIGVPETNIATDVARQVTKTHEKTGWGGNKMLLADEVNLNYAHFGQKVTGVMVTDTSIATRIAGMEITGNIGWNSYRQLTMHLDYRDALVKFEFTQGRGFDNSNLDQMDVDSTFR